MASHPRGHEPDDEVPGPGGPGTGAGRGRLAGLTHPPLPRAARAPDAHPGATPDGTARMRRVEPAAPEGTARLALPDLLDAGRAPTSDPERVALDRTIRSEAVEARDWDDPDDDRYAEDDDRYADDERDDAADDVPLTALPDAPGAAVSGATLEPNPTGAPPARTGKAGRDMVAAIGVGLSLGAVILGSLVVYKPAFLVVVVAAVLVSVVELTRALRTGQYDPPLTPLLVGSLAMVALAWERGPTGLAVGFFLTVFAVLLWRLGDGPVGYLRDASTGVFVALYVPLLAGFAVLLTLPDDGVARVIAFIATVVASDVGGFQAGVLFGKHKMAESVSPKKTWEGMAGSVVACSIAGALFVTLMLDGSWWGGVLFGVAIAITATVGDLGESLLKRDLAIKDMGHLLPGHGGLMDRMDSLLPSAAVAYLILSVVAPT